MRDSERMLMSNNKLLKCLFLKNFSQISKFLELLEFLCLTHLLNYFIDNKGIINIIIITSFSGVPSFGAPSCWPI